ncbi:unnamed protein product [Spirodela intermedia]|uniref:Protein RIK n=1 Tax=Spirodela intermedia TaxID=51605 RepID=A0A7I8I7T8_SPIIN|nr:unnamed protein product [Spirodela intermedia]CAA6653518.1 unnamed protein product [Spirodela intermedia]
MSAESFAKASEEPGAAAAAAAKKRKWDQPAGSLFSDGLPVPGSLPFDIGPLTGIGITTLSSSLFMSTVAAPKIQDELIAREIVINDADASVRSKLTKRQMQEEIQKSTGAVVITRGKYRPPNALPDNEKPLYLHISAGAHLKDTAERIKAVDRAASMVEEILKQGHSSSLVSTSYSTLNNGGQVFQPLTRCLYLGFDVDPSVNIAARIRGPNDQYINHIMNETGATVTLRGRGSGNVEIPTAGDTEQPLHLYLSSSNQKSLEDARILAENLLDTISLECGASSSSSPRQLLDGVECSENVNGSSVPATVCPSIDATAGKFSSALLVSSASTVCLPGTSLNDGVTNYGSQQTNISSYSPSSIFGGANYSGYGGIYPQATPLQQVALALRRPPVSTASSPTVTSPLPATMSAGTSLKTTLSSGAEPDKRPQRRKFQELPVASNGPPRLHQGLESLKHGVSSDDLLVGSASTSSPPPKMSDPPQSNGMPPLPPLKTIPPPLPPVPKFWPLRDDHMNGSPKAPTKGPVPDPLMKLMEYGDEDEDEDEDGDSGSSVEHSGTNSTATTAATPKPFWAV